MGAMPLSATRWIAVVGDLVEGWPPRFDDVGTPDDAEAHWRGSQEGLAAPDDVEAERAALRVVGGYLERLPLACVKAGLVDHAEIWHFARHPDVPRVRRESPTLTRRVFRLDREGAPFVSGDLLGFVRAFGAPHILCVLGLGVAPEILDACGASLKVYNSIDAPAIRVPDEVGRRFDLVLTGAEWQSDEVRARHPGMACAVMPIGPEFADPETFRPLGLEKDADVIYVAAAQGYKRHDILFDALARLPRDLKAICVFGYGEMAGELRHRAGELGLDVEFVGPPGVSFDEVNRLMNRARIGVVCGVDDGAPAILTEYMLAGLPVLANAGLRCGLQFIAPETGRVASAEEFHLGIAGMLRDLDRFAPREAVLARWTWAHTIVRLRTILDAVARERRKVA